MPKRTIKLGVSMIGMGYHLANWRHPDAPADGNMSLPHYIGVIQTAERGLFGRPTTSESRRHEHERTLRA